MLHISSCGKQQIVDANGLLPEAVGEIKVVRLVKDSKADERKKAKQPQWLTRQMLAAVCCQFYLVIVNYSVTSAK